MIIARPDSPRQNFEGIEHCSLGTINGAQLYPASKIVSKCGYEPVELIFESGAGAPGEASIELSVARVRSAVDLACKQYLRNVGSASDVEDRFQDYLTEDLGLSAFEAISIFRNEGIAPFLLLERVFISQPHSAVCLDFDCHGEGYLEEYGFSLDLLSDRVEFVTPRGSMREGSFPASRFA